MCVCVCVLMLSVAVANLHMITLHDPMSRVRGAHGTEARAASKLATVALGELRILN